MELPPWYACASPVGQRCGAGRAGLPFGGSTLAVSGLMVVIEPLVPPEPGE